MINSNYKGKKILIIATRPIIPDKDGKTLTMGQYTKILSEEYGCEVYYACFDLQSEQPKHIHPIGLNRPSTIEMIFNQIVYTFLLHRFPIQSSIMYSGKTKKRIKKLLEKENPDYVMCDMIRLVPYIEKGLTSYKKILDMDELVSKRYRTQVKVGTTDGSVLGQYQDKMPEVLVAIIEKLKIMRRLLLFEASFVEEYEMKAPNFFDKTFFCSPLDMREYETKSKKKAYCIHTALNNDYIDRPVSDDYDSKCIAYLGNMDAAPNKDSLIFLIEEVMSRLRKIDQQYHLIVIGKCSDESYRQFEKYKKFVDFTFFVEDMMEYTNKCLAMVVPVMYGSGVKSKIIQAMSMGIPVLTNDIGAEGIDAMEDELIVCNEPDRYCEYIIKLSNNKELRNMYSKNSREYLKKYHSYQNQINEVEQAILSFESDRQG